MSRETPRPVRSPLPGGAVLICRSCDRTAAKGLRKAFGRLLKALGRKDVRPLVTSCHDLCPGRGVAVTVTLAGAAPATFVVRDEADAELVVREIGSR